MASIFPFRIPWTTRKFLSNYSQNPDHSPLHCGTRASLWESRKKEPSLPCLKTEPQFRTNSLRTNSSLWPLGFRRSILERKRRSLSLGSLHSPKTIKHEGSLSSHDADYEYVVLSYPAREWTTNTNIQEETRALNRHFISLFIEHTRYYSCGDCEEDKILHMWMWRK